MASNRGSAGICSWLLIAAIGCGRQQLDLPPTTSSSGSAGASSGSAGASSGSAGASNGSAGAAGGAGTARDTSGPWLFFDSLRGVNRDIYAVQGDGSALVRLTSSTATEREPAVSPDGKTLAYSSDETGSFQLYLMPLPHGTPRQLTKGPMSAQQPAWSPNGQALSFRSDAGLFLIGVDGDGQRESPENPQDAGQNEHAIFAANDVLVFDRENQIHQLNLDTDAETSVVQNTTTIIEHPSLSPDGHSIVFDVRCFNDVAESIWIVPLAANTDACMGGARITTAQDGEARFPSFSSDGRIAFEHGSESVNIAVGAPGEPLKDITQGMDDRNPSWSPASLVLP